MAAKKGIISPMEASLKRAARETGPSGTNYNGGEHVYTYGLDGDPLKHLTAPPWPDNLSAEGNISGSSKRPGTIAGKRYGEGFADTTLDEEPTSPTWKQKGR